MKELEYDRSWVPKLHWLEVSEGHSGWVAQLKYKSYEDSGWDKTLYRELIMMESRTKPNWLGVSKLTTTQVMDVLDLKESDIITAFDKLKGHYLVGAEFQQTEAEKSRIRQELLDKYTGRLGS